jgi:hypothetical protein
MISALNRANANPDAFRVAANRYPQWEAVADRTIDVYEKLFTGDAAQQSSRAVPSRI